MKEIQLSVKTVLSQEIGLRVANTRFYNRKQTATYPINIVIYNNRRELGYFNADFYELGFHECLMHQSKDVLHNVIRHELAHYMIFINKGPNVQHHGVEFRDFCRGLNWGSEVYDAVMVLSNPIEVQAESAVFRKVQKLMALATSSNAHEAEQAMIKSQQLLLKHNIESEYLDADDGKVILKRIMKFKKISAKTRAIGKILETFFVSIVYNRGGEYTYLEILGESVNVDIAEYVAGVLDVEFDNLWWQAQREALLSGVVAKNSFFMGIAKGYCDKIQALKRDYTQEVSKALLVIEKKFVDAREMAYSRLSSVKSSGSYCPNSSALGEKVGRDLNINPALSQKAGVSSLLIGLLGK